MDCKIIPSIIAFDQKDLDERINKIRKLSKFVQLDIMDGKFVKNTSLQFDFALPKKISYEAHLMVKDPHLWLTKNSKYVSSVIVHYESGKLPFPRHEKIKHGVALNPETPAKAIRKYLDDIDKILVMTVNPGKYGSKFLPETLDKIKFLRSWKPKLTIQVDGGINPSTLKLCKQAGANEFVVGSYLQNASNVEQAWKELNDVL